MGNEGAGTKDGAGTSETNGNVPGSASGSEEGAKTGTDAETSVGITAPLVSFSFGVRRIPFSPYWPSGVIRIGLPSMKVRKVEMFKNKMG